MHGLFLNMAYFWNQVHFDSRLPIRKNSCDDGLKTKL